MKIECPAIDSNINVKECLSCECKCDSEIKLNCEEMICSIFAKMFPSLTFVDARQAYERIMRGIK